MFLFIGPMSHHLSSSPSHYFSVLDDDSVIASVNAEYMSEDRVLDHIEQLHQRYQAATTPHGIPYLKTKTRQQLCDLLDNTLVLIRQNQIVGTVHHQDVPDYEATASIDGFISSEKGYGSHLLCAALQRTWSLGYQQAISVTAAPNAKKLFRRYESTGTKNRFANYLEQARQRYGEDDHLVELFVFEPGKSQPQESV